MFVSEFCWTTKYSVVVKSNFPKAIPVSFDKQLYGPLPAFFYQDSLSVYGVLYHGHMHQEVDFFFVLWIMLRDHEMKEIIVCPFTASSKPNLCMISNKYS